MQQSDHILIKRENHFPNSHRHSEYNDTTNWNASPTTPFHSENNSWAPPFTTNTLNETGSSVTLSEYHYEHNSPMYTPTTGNAETTYSPLLHSPLSPNSYRLSPTPTYQFLLQPSLMLKTEGRDSTLFSSSTDLHNSSPFVEEETDRMWGDNHSPAVKAIPAPPRNSIESRMRAPYPLSSRIYGATKPFILKLGFLLSRADLYGDVAKWDATGSAFIIMICPRLTKEVLPELFNHSSCTAFTRQLTTYSFSHLKPIDLPETERLDARSVSIWKHIYFTQGDTTTLNRLLPRPSRARAEERKLKIEKSTLVAYSASFLANKL